MEDDDFGIFYGFGSVHDLRDADGETPRLAGLKSVSPAAMWALHKTAKPKRHPMGFHSSLKRNRR